MFNELSSFVDLSYRKRKSLSLSHTELISVPTGLIQTATGPAIAVGFTNDAVRTFLDSFVLVLLVVFQVTCFSVAFLRLFKAFTSQRRNEKEADLASEHEVHLFNGLGWIAGGIILGALDSVIGFAGGGYGGAITRRVLRFLSRACLVIGVVKGCVDPPFRSLMPPLLTIG